MNKKIGKFLTNIIFWEYAILSLVILLICIFSHTYYSCKKEFNAPNILLLIIGCLFIFALVVILDNISLEKKWLNINIASIILFLLQIYISYNIYFDTGWDAGLVLGNAQSIAGGAIEQVDMTYYSQWSNNNLLLLVETFVIKINDIIGVFNFAYGKVLLVVIQCLLSTLAGKLLYDIINDYTKSKSIAWVGWFIYVILIGLSGWNVIVYTDMMAFIFPTAILRVYQYLQNNKDKKFFCWGLIIFLTYWGSKMKPTAGIVTIAIVLIEIIDCIKEFDKAKLKNIAIISIISVISVVLYSSIFLTAKNYVGLKTDPGRDIGYLHLIMMGMNPETDGVWDADDVALSSSIIDKEERVKAQKTVIKQRLKDYGVKGFLKHMWKKTLVNFNDGSFAWGEEGNFFANIYDNRNNTISPRMRSLYYTDGVNYKKLGTIEQIFWITSLFLSLGIVVLKKDKINLVVVLSLIGITIFVSVFEARARYLLLYVPFYIIAASFICWKVLVYINKKVAEKYGSISKEDIEN